MIPEQATIKLEGSEIPLLALREPLVWIMVAMVFLIAVIWVRRRYR